MSIAAFFFTMDVPLAYWIAAVFVGLWLLLRPRRGGPKAPPMVLNSPVVPIPFIGCILEFAKSPVKMVRRCYDDYGPVYTVPVSTRAFLREILENANANLPSCLSHNTPTLLSNNRFSTRD
jgi:hypothetical protein